MEASLSSYSDMVNALVDRIETRTKPVTLAKLTGADSDVKSVLINFQQTVKTYYSDDRSLDYLKVDLLSLPPVDKDIVQLNPDDVAKVYGDRICSIATDWKASCSQQVSSTKMIYNGEISWEKKKIGDSTYFQLINKEVEPVDPLLQNATVPQKISIASASFFSALSTSHYVRTFPVLSAGLRGVYSVVSQGTLIGGFATITVVGGYLTYKFLTVPGSHKEVSTIIRFDKV